MNGAGALTMVRIQLHTQWKALVVWIVGLAGSLVGTAVMIAQLYDTPAEIRSYAAAVEGGALYAINGRVEGIGTLGGVIQDEFGFMAAFLLPLLGISLLARSTRREEENGRTELLLAGRVDRRAPVAAAVTVATATIAMTTAVSAVGLAGAGVPPVRGLLYALSLGALAFVFAGLAAFAAQLTQHARTVYAIGFAALLAAYVVRGIGDATGTWIAWMSPLGWQEKTAPFGAMRWWALAIPIVAGIALASAAVVMSSRRDVGSAVLTDAAGPPRAASWLRSPAGTAFWIHRPSLIGWLLGSLVLAGTMGALAQQVIDAMVGNPGLADAIGADQAHPERGFLAVTQLYLAIIACGFVVQAIGGLHHEESVGRLEPRLSGAVSRTHWLAAHGVVILGGLVVIALAGSTTFALAAAWSSGSTAETGSLIGAGLAYLPAEAVVAAVALVCVGYRPRLFPAIWFAYGAVTFIAFLGPGLQLASWILDLAPTTHVGNPPLGQVNGLPITVLSMLAIALTATAFVGFRRRSVPQG